MPELPEVETVRKRLEQNLIGKKITDVKVFYTNMIINSQEEFIKIKNQTINAIKRRGKWLIFDLDDYYLLSHLRMEGKYYIKPLNDLKDKHTHVIFNINDEFNLFYNDVRKFGRMQLITKDKLEETINIGLEPFSNELTCKYLQDKYKNSKLPIKSSLLDQTIIAGIGNIYADEILYAANINPLKQTNSLTKKELENIIVETQKILKKAIEFGGTTIKTYEAMGNHGNFQNELMVHTKAGNSCIKCGTIIEKITVNGRGTYYCRKCQK